MQLMQGTHKSSNIMRAKLQIERFCVLGFPANLIPKQKLNWRLKIKLAMYEIGTEIVANPALCLAKR